MDETPMLEDRLLRFHQGELSGEEEVEMRRLLVDDNAVRAIYDGLIGDVERMRAYFDQASAAALPSGLSERLWQRVSARIARAGPVTDGPPGADRSASPRPASRGPAQPDAVAVAQAATPPPEVVVPLPAPDQRRPAAGAPPRRRAPRADVASRLTWGALAASVLLFVAGVSFEAGVHRGSGVLPPVAAVADWTPAPREQVLLAQVQRHLGASERLLLDFGNAAAYASVAPEMDAQALAAEQEWARTLLFANRLYRFVAERSGQPRIAELLGDLEPVLIELANGSLAGSPEYTRAMRESLNQGDLLLRVRAARLETGPAGAVEDPKEETI